MPGLQEPSKRLTAEHAQRGTPGFEHPQAVKTKFTAGRSGEDMLLAALRRTQTQIEVLGQLGHADEAMSGDVEAFARTVTELAAKALGCERVNVWLFDRSESRLECIDLFETASSGHSAGMILEEQQFRNEFRVLRTSRYVAADDPLTDPRTAGYVESYLKPLDIRSMLDAVINASGRNFGLVCFEHVGKPHHWEQDEIGFCCQLADKIGLVLLNRMRAEAEERLRQSEEKFRNLVETTSDYIWEVDEDGRYTYQTPKVVKLMGYTPAEMVGRTPFDFMAPDEAKRVAAAVEPYLRARQPFSMLENTILNKDGTSVVVETSGVPIFGAGGAFRGYRGVDRDLTERRRADEQIRRMARTDGLTGLANRADFVETMQREIARANRTGVGFAILYLDLDHFKDVNDTLGHPAGDVLLKSVADRLSATVREVDTVARFGGDEFALIAIDIGDPTGAAVLAEAVLAAMAKSIFIAGKEIHSGASIGIALYGPDTPDAESLLSRADVALYRAKSEGRGTYRFFTNEMDLEVRTRVRLGSELREAIAADQLFLVYQPQVDIRTGRIVGLEALVRWRHPQQGVVSPSEFIPAAETSGLIGALGGWVLNEACRQTRRWLDAGLSVPLIAVNISGMQFKRPMELEDSLKAALAATALPADMLELELTESVLMDATRDHNQLLTRLRAEGVRIAVDDFGTGYSSLGYLSRFPVDRIKIAQDFLHDLRSGSVDAKIVKAAIGLAQDLDLDVIVEGVETAEQLALVASWGCRKVQGFYFSRPLPADAMATCLRTGRVSPVRDLVPVGARG